MTAKDGKTELQRKFEEQTPTIHGIKGKEYLFTFIAWLEFQVDKKEKQLSEAVKLIDELKDCIVLSSYDNDMTEKEEVYQRAKGFILQHNKTKGE